MPRTSKRLSNEAFGRRWRRQWRRSAVLVAACAAWRPLTPLSAASWDPVPGLPGAGNGTVDGGGGTWSSALANWTTNGGATNTFWVSNDPAVFGGATGGTVTVLGNLSASSLTFDITTNSANKYILVNSGLTDSIILAGTPAITTNQDATINATLAGTAGFTKSGSATLTLGGTNTFGGNVIVSAGRLSIGSSANLGAATNGVTLQNGATLRATAGFDLGSSRTLALGTGGGSLELAGAAMTASGLLSGSGALTIDAAFGGTLAVTNLSNFNGSSNTFTGNVNLISTGGSAGSAALRYKIAAPSGQTFSASAGTLTLGGSVSGATVTLNNGAVAQASGGGVIELHGRAAATGIGVTIAGDLSATAGGKIFVGDGASDASQVQFATTSDLIADNGTITLRPRTNPMTLDSASIGTITVKNGGVLALAGNADLTIGRSITPTGTWTLANQSANLLRIAQGSQTTTSGLVLRAEGGTTRYEADAITIGTAAANGTLNVDLRGGTVDINNGAPGKNFGYASGYTLSGWGQIGTTTANQTHVIAAGGATFYASSPGNALSIVGGFNEASGGKAAFRIGDNAGLMLSLPTTSLATAYRLNSVAIDAQGAASVAKLMLASGYAAVNGSAFTAPANDVRFDIQGGTLLSDLSSTGTVLLSGGSQGASVPIQVNSGGSFITTSSTFNLKSSELIGGNGTLFGYNGTATTALTLGGVLYLSGNLGASVSSASTGVARIDSGTTLTLGAAADFSNMSLAYAGGAGNATLEVNAPSTTTRIATTTGITAPYGAFTGTRQFTVTAGTLQIDAADASSVGINGINTLSIDRTNDATINPADLGTLTLNGGSFVVGTTASTTTVNNSALFSGKGAYGHTGVTDVFVNNGTVAASGGSLTINAATASTGIKGNGNWDPAGQTIVLNGNVGDIAAGVPTQLKVSGAGGGTLQLKNGGSYTGGTIVDGSSGGTGVNLLVTVAGALGTGSVSLNTAALTLNFDNNLTYGGTDVFVSGSNASTIAYNKLATGSGKTITLRDVSVNGQTLNLTGGNSYTLSLNSINVGASGASIVNTGSPVKTARTSLAGPLSLVVTSLNYSLGALTGGGSISRTFNSGTLYLDKASSSFSGYLLSTGGTTNFTGSNALSGGTFTLGGGTFNVNTAYALNLAIGDVQQGTTATHVWLNAGDALSGGNLTHYAGSVYATVANALGTGTINLAGGRLTLRSDPATSFGGNVGVTGASSSTMILDRASASGTGGYHSIASLTFSGQRLNVIGNNGYGLNVVNGITVNAGAASELASDAPDITAPSLTLNGDLYLTNGGPMTIGRIGGSGLLSRSGAASLEITGAPLPGWNGTVRVDTAFLDLNTVAGSLAGGSLAVTGGEVNLGVASALTGTATTLSSGFVHANVSGALNSANITITNGTLRGMANNALGNATINMSGGNVQARAAGALGTSTINVDGAVVALRGDVSAAYGGSVVISGTNAAILSAAPLNPGSGPTAQTLTISSLAFGGQTLNITGSDNYIFGVVNPITLSGSNATTINTTAADALFQGLFSGSGALIKSGVRTLTLGGGAAFGSATVSDGTLIVNGAWTTTGASVGSSNGAAVLQMGGGGVNNIGPTLTLNAGTVRVSKAVVTDAIGLATTLNVASAGDVDIEYAGGLNTTAQGILANNLNVDLSTANRVVTISAPSSGTQVSHFNYAGQIITSGSKVLTVTAQADAPLDDGVGNLVRSPSRLILSGTQSFTTDMVHGGGIVIGKGNVPAPGTSGPFGRSTNALSLKIADSTVGGTVLNGQTTASFAGSVTNAATNAPRARLGAFYNPYGGAGAQTITFSGSFAWNDPSNPLYVVTPAGNPAGAMLNSSWAGLFADSGTVLQINNGGVLDNITAASGTNVTGTVPLYVGGGGTVRFASTFDESTYRNLSQLKGLSGAVTVLDNTILQSQTDKHHFDGIELRSGTYQVSGVNQAISGGFAVNQSSFDSSRKTSTLMADMNLALSGTGAAKALKIAAGQTLLKTGAGTLTINSDQAHGAGSTLQADQGVVTFNTDAGMNGASPALNNLTIAASNSATVNLNVTEHIAQVVVGGSALVKLASSTTPGSKIIDSIGVAVTGSGKLDLTNNHLIIDYSGATPIASVRSMLTSGYNRTGARWNGAGIMSSTAAGDTGLSLGYAEASQLLGSSGGNFAGETVDATAVIVRYTRSGDANLDGKVDFSDLVVVSQNYKKAGASWWSGDFNYDGSVDFADLVTVSQNYKTSVGGVGLASAGSFASDWQLAMSMAVPEPSAISLLALGSLCMLGRRRRRND